MKDGLHDQLLFRLVQKQGHVVMKPVDDLYRCDHGLYVPFCDHCQAQVPDLCNPKPVSANMGIQFLVTLYIVTNGLPLLETHSQRLVELIFEMKEWLLQ